MPTNLTGQTVASTYDQLLHVDDGPAASEKTVYSGTGVATAFKVGTQSASVDNVQIDGNTISTLNTDGDLVLAPNGTGAVTIAKAAISGGTVAGTTLTGGNLQLTANTFSSTNTNRNIVLAPNGTGSVLATGAFGYGTGTGGTVTQDTSKSTTVVLDKVCGQITLNNAELAANTTVSFAMTNSTVAAGDVLVLNHLSGGTVGSYLLNAQCGAGSATINVRNITGGALSEAIVIAFVVIKAVSA
jgi:hypothetical protein